jgi:hypothetical protein
MKKVGLWLAIAALLVNGPRFVLIFLMVDSLTIPVMAETIMLSITGIATGLVLTGGGAYIAHSLAESQTRGMVRNVMIICWFLLLIFNIILLAPLMVSAIRESPLKNVFETDFSQWLWSITSVLAVEIISAGAMAAYALEGKTANAPHHDSQQSAFSILTGALVRRLETSIAPQPAIPVITSHQSVNQVITNHRAIPDTANGYESQSQDEKIEEIHVTGGEELSEVEQERRYAKTERQSQLLELLRYITREADIQVDKLAERFKVSQQTIYRDLADLKSQNRLKIEGSVIRVIG